MLSSFGNVKISKLYYWLIAAAIWVFYAMFGPGDEFFNGYRWLVLNPNELIPKFGHPIMFNPPGCRPYWRLLSPCQEDPGIFSSLV